MVTYNKFYTKGEEIFNSVSHGIGIAISIAACVLMILQAAFNSGAMSIVSASIFGTALIALYTMSTLYHAISSPKAKSVLRIFDHCTIFILISGTYTPFTLITMGGALGWTLFGVLWGLTVLGIILNAISIEKFKKISMVFYLLMGWCVLFAIKPTIESLGIYGSLVLLAGGIFYTGGIMFYNKKNIKYMHSIWHIFVLLGSICHILCVLFWVL